MPDNLDKQVDRCAAIREIPQKHIEMIKAQKRTSVQTIFKSLFSDFPTRYARAMGMEFSGANAILSSRSKLGQKIKTNESHFDRRSKSRRLFGS